MRKLLLVFFAVLLITGAEAAGLQAIREVSSDSIVPNKGTQMQDTTRRELADTLKEVVLRS